MKKILAVCLSIVMSFICCSGVFSADTENPSDTLKEMGILKGYPDGSLHLEDTITRAEATALLVRLDNLEFNSSSAFKDIHGQISEYQLTKTNFSCIMNIEKRQDLNRLCLNTTKYYNSRPWQRRLLCFYGE